MSAVYREFYLVDPWQAWPKGSESHTSFYQPQDRTFVLSAENSIWDNTQHLLTSALANYQLICK
ncbi:hypothetical protein NP493_301g04000 [Ridgeia piscesae]|uniref:Uncharacterized protein n=1 Tax=Ridgeia piscesae TaxID=27915 RepID=A0AAD9L5X2_RIDPI|nr:hypothetical protein NP493_301g04000 [Ridgeia piscesae]